MSHVYSEINPCAASCLRIVRRRICGVNVRRGICQDAFRSDSCCTLAPPFSKLPLPTRGVVSTYIYIYIYIYTYIHTYIHTYINTHIHIHIHICIHMHIHIHIQRERERELLYVYMYVCICIYIYIYILEGGVATSSSRVRFVAPLQHMRR